MNGTYQMAHNLLPSGRHQAPHSVRRRGEVINVLIPASSLALGRGNRPLMRRRARCTCLGRPVPIVVVPHVQQQRSSGEKPL